MDQVFENQKFIPLKELVRSITESQIELEIPTDTRGYTIEAHNACQVSYNMYLLRALMNMIFRFKNTKLIMHLNSKDMHGLKLVPIHHVSC